MFETEIQDTTQDEDDIGNVHMVRKPWVTLPETAGFNLEVILHRPNDQHSPRGKTAFTGWERKS